MRMSFLLFLSVIYIGLFAQTNSSKSNPPDTQFERINSHEENIQYDLNQIIGIIETSISEKKPIVAPQDATDFEKSLFNARRIQHNDSQLQAIKQFKYLLEFESYRTEGEKLYIRYLLATSLKYIGSPLIASKYLDNVFPEFLEYLNDYHYKSFFLNQYAGLLVSIDSLEKAKKIYKQIINYSLSEEDTSLMYRSRNNYGYVLMQLHEYDSASKYIRLNQNPSYKNINEILFAFSYGNYGTLLHKLGKLDSALYYCQLEVSMLNDIPSIIGLSNTYEMIGDIYLELNQVDSAEKYFIISMEFAKKEEVLDQIIGVHEKLLIQLIKKRNQDDLLYLINDYFDYNDSLKEQISFKTYEDEAKISKFMEILIEAQLSKKNSDELEASNRELLYVIIALTLLIIILVVLVLVRKSGRRKISAANIELIKKNTELKESYQTISETSQKNETLLRELHHRVKNNLQMISSLFNLQLNAHNMDSITEQVFRSAQDRIHSISLVHKKIYQSDNIAYLEFGDYLNTFSNELIKSSKEKVDVEIKLKPIDLTIDNAIPLGLIFNELFTNSIKHANAKELLKIHISAEKNGQHIKFIYKDNGIGVSPKDMTEDRQNSIGLTLIHLLANQLETKISFEAPSDGKAGFYFSLEGLFE